MIQRISQNETNTLSRVFCLALAFGTLASKAAFADILYDTTFMTDDQSYNDVAVPSKIAAFQPTALEVIHDSQAADDFTIKQSCAITRIVGDFVSDQPFSGEGVLVEFFADDDGAPSARPTAQVFTPASEDLTVSSFSNAVDGALFPEGVRLTMDLSAAGIVLDAGTWWVSVVPVHESVPSQVFQWVRTQNYEAEVGTLHIRDGGEAHGNGYAGTWGVSDWTPIDIVFSEGDVAMRVEGTVEQDVPGDLDGSGTVGVDDLLILLGNWGTDSDGADLATPVSIVDVADLLELLSKWGS